MQLEDIYIVQYWKNSREIIMSTLISYLVCLLTNMVNPQVLNYSYKPLHNNKQLEYVNRTLFVFGDSLFDSGNNQYLNNNASINKDLPVWPYGETFFHFPTGRLSDGRIVPDFVAKYAKLPMPSPYLQPGYHRFRDGTNFASAGAGVLVETNPGTISLPMQLSYFKAMDKLLRLQLGDIETNKVLKRAVYLFSIGGNDYFTFSTNNPNATESCQTRYVDMVIGNLTSVLKEIYNLGGRKIAFQNAGPLGCVPELKAEYLDLGSGCAELPLALARLHNRALSISLNKLQNQLPGLKYSIFDYYNALLGRVNYPLKYGLKEGKAACCGSGAYRGIFDCGVTLNGTKQYELCKNPGEYVWFDGAHTTERANRQLAELIWSGPPSLTGPYNVQQLFHQHV